MGSGRSHLLRGPWPLLCVVPREALSRRAIIGMREVHVHREFAVHLVSSESLLSRARCTYYFDDHRTRGRWLRGPESPGLLSRRCTGMLRERTLPARLVSRWSRRS